jgi:hypothetical protein
MNQAIHIWAHCHCCGMDPIIGPAYRCETCPVGSDVDLCSSCYADYLSGSVAHPIPEALVNLDRATHQFIRIDGSAPATFHKWLKVIAKEQSAPQVPSAFVVRPEFLSGRESTFGAYGFIIRFGRRTLLLTALHVMDELIKRKHIDATKRSASFTGEDLAKQVTSVRLYDVLQELWMLCALGDAGPMLVLPNARIGEQEPIAFRDIAAFHVKSQQTLSSVRLANEDPEPGDPVWLAAAMPDQSRTRRAVCVENTPRCFIFRYEEPKRLPNHASGAPILDRHGAVVGINTGRGRLGKYEVGHANPLSSIRAHLAEAL